MANQLTMPVGPRDHMIGEDRAPITLVEYGDYECPHCARASSIVNRILSEMGPRLRFVFRNFPLSRIHPNAEAAAQFAEAASAQGQYWQAHELLFENHESLELESLATFASELGLDIQKILSDLEEGRYAARVKEDLRSGVESGVDATPGFFINGERYEGSWEYEPLRAALESYDPRAATEARAS